jgi:N-glycosylase/DNA lyase
VIITLAQLILDLSKYHSLNLDNCFKSGQIFGWRKVNGHWYGITRERLMKVCQQDNKLIITSDRELDEQEVVSFFALDDDMEKCNASIALNLFLRSAISRYSGIRILRQAPVEAIISYICAQNKNIPAIERMISELSCKYGLRRELDGIVFYTLPTMEDLARLSLRKLCEAGLGYRARYLVCSAKKLVQCDTFTEKIENMNYFQAWQSIAFGNMKLAGVGPKVADCILLYGFNMMEAFPIDVWISRSFTTALAELVDRDEMDFLRVECDKKMKIDKNTYLRMGNLARRIFKNYSGYAQLYTYMYSKDYFRYF